METRSIAVVGGGIAGLATAWLLGKRHRVTLFEKNAYIGGHTHTVDVSTEQGPVAVDTGFIVYNEQNYPHLTALLRHLGVTSQPSDMSFSVSIGAGSVEYAGNSLNTLFAQRANLISPTYAGMLLDILRFNRSAKRLLSEQPAEQLTLGDFLSRGGYSEAFRDYYVLPMAAAIWSCPTGAMLRFPLLSFVRFFANHGLLNLSRRPMWRTVVGGGRSYVERILNSGRMSVHRADPVERVSRDTAGVWVQTACGYRDRFDQVVLACHADQALAIIEQPRDGEARVLGSFHYQANRAVLHSDISLMPVRRRAWASWNYLASTPEGGAHAVTVTYWLNRLQRLGTRMPLLVTLNPPSEPASEVVLKRMTYHHPVFDAAAIAAQKLIRHIQGQDRLWFCGSYCGHGFHEDALRSALTVARGLGVEAPWLERQVHPIDVHLRHATQALTP